MKRRAAQYAAALNKLSNSRSGWDIPLGWLIGRYEASSELLRWVFVGLDGTPRVLYDLTSLF